MEIQWTLELQTSLAPKFRFDLQPENQPTDQKKTKMEQKRNKNGWLWITVVTRIATLIRSRINVAIRIRRYAGGKTPKERIKLHLMCSYGGKPHR